MALVSVIMPIFNAEKYLRQSLESVIAQSVKDIEIICINDGSTDGSLSILREYAARDNRIVIINKDNAGTEAARNDALNVAKGKFVSFIDADDAVDERFLEKLLAGFENENISLVQCNYDAIAEDGINRPTYKIKVKNSGALPAEKYRNDLITTALFRREIIEKYKIRIPDVHYFGDTYFKLCYLACSKQMYIITDNLYHYRFRKDSLCGQYINAVAEQQYKTDLQYFAIMDKVLRFIKKYQNHHKAKTGFKNYLHCVLGWKILKYSGVWQQRMMNKAKSVFCTKRNRFLFEKQKCGWGLRLYRLETKRIEIKIYCWCGILIFRTIKEIRS